MKIISQLLDLIPTRIRLWDIIFRLWGDYFPFVGEYFLTKVSICGIRLTEKSEDYIPIVGFDSHTYPFVGYYFPFVGDYFPFVGEYFPFMGDYFPLIGITFGRNFPL